jgi:hypothetical protein
MASYLSPAQVKALAREREPIRHAMDRLIERHFPDLDDDGAADMIKLMQSLCTLRQLTGDRNTAKMVMVENDHSHIIDLDLFEDRELIRVCYDPIECRIRTVFPKAN